jgi:erythromycin esterase-like protein
MMRVRWSATLRVIALLLLILGGVPIRGVPGNAIALSSVGAQTAPAAPQSLLATVREAARPLTGDARDYDSLLTLVGDARIVLIGDATHGTHEFYRERARITQRLIREKGFTAVAIEGDWPDAYRANRYVRGTSADVTAEQALSSFTRFPRWMWGNTVVRDFVEWLRDYNEALPAATARVGFYGLDLYSLFSSIDVVVQFLEREDPEAARRARERYACFARYGSDPEAYARAAASTPDVSCERGALEQFQELQQWTAARMPQADAARREELFSLLQNARVVKDAEEYYRSLYRGAIVTWNMRDRHMAETLDALAAHHDAPERPAKLVVWAHNSHVGDARATELGEAGEWNIGQLMRERHSGRAVLVGFTTYTGTVMAASDWGEPGQVQQVRPALPESYAAVFHDTGIASFLLLLRGSGALAEALAIPRLERAIGVVYRPETERASHYFQARLSEQFDAVIHLDTTRAVEPLEP